jgi:uncharacterized membrane protein YeaQ/YmgE (transglycosylase-associated protein family)
MSILAWIILYGIIGFFEISNLVKNKNKKELTIYIVAFTSALALSILLTLGVKIPSYDVYIGQLIRSITGE